MNTVEFLDTLRSIAVFALSIAVIYGTLVCKRNFATIAAIQLQYKDGLESTAKRVKKLEEQMKLVLSEWTEGKSPQETPARIGLGYE